MLTNPARGLLALVAGAETVDEAAARMGVTRENANAAVRRLLRAGYVEQSVKGKVGRGGHPSRFRVTKKGRGALVRLRNAVS